jgi:hypothetical protein
MVRPHRRFALLAVLVCLTIGTVVSGRQAGSTITLSVKGSPAFTKPSPAPVAAALLVVTPSWDDVKVVTQVGGQEASGQPLFLTDLAVVLASKPLDCAAAFKAPAPSGDDFLIVLGKAEAYLPAKGWQTTSIGKTFMADSSSNLHYAVDKFSVDAQQGSLKKKISKDGLKGNDGRLVLDSAAGAWNVDFAVKADDVTAEGKLPLTLCSIGSRKKAESTPLLGENRLMNAWRSF